MISTINNLLEEKAIIEHKLVSITGYEERRTLEHKKLKISTEIDRLRRKEEFKIGNAKQERTEEEKYEVFKKEYVYYCPHKDAAEMEDGNLYCPNCDDIVYVDSGVNERNSDPN